MCPDRSSITMSIKFLIQYTREETAPGNLRRRRGLREEQSCWLGMSIGFLSVFWVAEQMAEPHSA